MTTQEKLDLQWKVRFCIGQGLSRKDTITKLLAYGFQKRMISKYYAAFIN